MAKPQYQLPARPNICLITERLRRYLPTPQQYSTKARPRGFSIPQKKTLRCRSEDCSANPQKLSSSRGKQARSIPPSKFAARFQLTLNRFLLNNYDSLRENRQGHEAPTVSVRESPSGEITIMVRVRSLTGVTATIVQRGIYIFYGDLCDIRKHGLGLTMLKLQCRLGSRYPSIPKTRK